MPPFTCAHKRHFGSRPESSIPGQRRELDNPVKRGRRLPAAYDLSRDRPYGHIKPRKRRGESLVFCRYLHTLYTTGVRLGIVNASWLNRIEAQFQARRSFTSTALTTQVTPSKRP
jgi:hypothetical protein